MCELGKMVPTTEDILSVYSGADIHVCSSSALHTLTQASRAIPSRRSGSRRLRLSTRVSRWLPCSASLRRPASPAQHRLFQTLASSTRRSRTERASLKATRRCICADERARVCARRHHYHPLPGADTHALLTQGARAKGRKILRRTKMLV